MLPSINLILPYYYPRHYVGTTDAAIRDLSRTALENTLSILHALEQAHQEQFSTALTLRRLGEALYRRTADGPCAMTCRFPPPPVWRTICCGLTASVCEEE